jgi:hypothetical protein
MGSELNYLELQNSIFFKCCFYTEWKRRRDTSRRHGSDRRLRQHHVRQPGLQQNHSDDPDSGVERHHDGRRWTSAAASGKSSSDNVRTPCNYFCRVLSASWFSYFQTVKFHND